jgi:SAM-dependent methyltransferase
MQPLANSFLKNSDEFPTEKKYPLEVYFCHSCNLTQLLDVVDKKEMFSNYIYFSSGMPKLSDHFRLYAEDIMKRFLKHGDFVVELASNDGILLKFFQDAGYKVLGIDPAENVVKIAEKIGVHTLVDFFSQNLAKKVATEYGQAKVIMANNVVAHIDDHHDLAKGLGELLAEDGVFVFEAPYLVDMFNNLTYDTIYHEHLSLLSIRPLIKLFENFGLELFDVEIHPVQGQSLRSFVGRKGKHPVTPNVKKYIDLELSMGLDKLETYQTLAKRVENQKIQLTELLGKLKSEGKKVAAYGAPAKGNTMLNYLGIGTDILDYALEDLPAKQNMYTPGMHIPTVDAVHAHSFEPDYYLMLAWNYEKPILEKEKQFLAKGGHFIIPVEGIRLV